MFGRLPAAVALASLLLAGAAHAESLAPDPNNDPADFTDAMKRISATVACDGNAVDDRFSPKLLKAHCADLDKRVTRPYHEDWIVKARPFFDTLVPKDIPKTIVYPFGGADLLTVLAVYPDLEELTSISLEAGGDPRSFASLSNKQLKKSLKLHRQFLFKLVDVNHSRTLDLSRLKGDPLPSQVVFALVGLKVHGYEPVGLKYFKVTDSGAIAYLTPAQIEATSAELDGKYKGSRLNRKRADFFSNFELRFKKSGVADAPVQTYRHIRANLDDKHLAGETKGVLAHLKAKGKVTAITKAASYLLWWRNFSTIRQYLLDHMVWMVSDSTGIPANFIDTAVHEQTTYGRFRATAITGSPEGEAAFRKLWSDQPRRDLPFMFGYPSKAQHAHLVVTRRR